MHGRGDRRTGGRGDRVTVGAVAVRGVTLQVTGQIDDGDGLERTALATDGRMG